MDKRGEELTCVYNSGTPEIAILPEKRCWVQKVVIQEHGKRLAPALYVILRTLDFPLENRAHLKELERKSI